MAERRGLAGRIARDARKLADLDGKARADLVRAVAELARARLELIAVKPGTWLTSKAMPGRRGDQALIDRVAFAIPCAAARVPWKATCLVQALAAQRWLAAHGIASTLKLGARRSDATGLDAHAWLEAGGRVVVGGDIAGYQPFRPGAKD